jgi:hypothetical protein
MTFRILKAPELLGTETEIGKLERLYRLQLVLVQLKLMTPGLESSRMMDDSNPEEEEEEEEKNR